MCPFCVRVAFDRVVGGCVAKVYRLFRLGDVINFSSIVGHVKFENNVSIEERSWLVDFNKMRCTSL